MELGRSLLPVGVKSVAGEFGKGEPISICDESGTEIARGLSNYASAVITKICGKKSIEIRSLLGEAAYDEVIHRDNLVVG